MATGCAHPLKIGLFGLFGSGNTGNDGSLEAFLALLRRVSPDAEITCICGNPAVVEKSHGIRALPFGLADPRLGPPALVERMLPRRLANWIRLVRHRRGFDVLIFPGTGILDDFGAGPWSLPLTILGWCLAARLGGAKIAFVSIGAGPIHHPISRRLMKWAAALAHYRSYRDTVSWAYMDGIGFDASHDAIFPDLAFDLPRPADPEPSPAGGPPVIGIGVMSYFGWSHDRDDGAPLHRAYLAKLTAFAVGLLDRGHRIRLLMGDAEDQRAVDALGRALNAERPSLPPGALVAEPAHSLHEVMRQIAETDIVVATRFHNVVCALKLGKPVASVGYAEKNDALLADMGLGAFCQPIDSFDVAALTEQVTTLLRERERHQRQIRHRLSRYEELLRRQERSLATDILALSPAP